MNPHQAKEDMAKRVKRLLACDWDYFTVTEGQAANAENYLMYDWGHSERWAEGLQAVIWMLRAQAFERMGMPLPTTSGQELTFWPRFTFSPGAKLWLGDSHVVGAEAARECFREVWNFDAHHDCGYRGRGIPGTVDCSSWMLAHRWFLPRAKLVVRYPEWKKAAFVLERSTAARVDRAFDDGAPDDRPFDGVVIAKSSSWTPPWLDPQFVAFVRACPLAPAESALYQPRTWPMEYDKQERITICA